MYSEEIQLCVCIHILFHIIFHYGLLQDIAYSSLCYTVGPYYLSLLFIYVFCFLGSYLQHMKVPWLGIESELQAQPHQHRIRAASGIYITGHSNTGSFNPLSKARDRTCMIMDTSWTRYQ